MNEKVRQLITSRKTIVALSTLVVALAARLGLNLDTDLVLGLIALGVSLITGIAIEDGAAKVMIPPAQVTGSPQAAPLPPAQGGDGQFPRIQT